MSWKSSRISLPMPSPRLPFAPLPDWYMRCGVATDDNGRATLARREHRWQSRRGRADGIGGGHTMTASLSSKPLRLVSPSGLTALMNANGSLRKLECGPVVLNLFPGSEVEGGPGNLYLRRRSTRAAWTPLLGPESPLAFVLGDGGVYGRGDWEGIEISLAFVLAASAPAWFWHIELQSRS